jgi:NhaP-type Na+/H+ or K+/H+ antiporter
MSAAIWFLMIGAVLLFMAVTAGKLERTPLSTAIVYLAIGVALGPMFANQFHFNPLEQSRVFEIFTEIAVLISLFAAGLKLAAPIGDRIWWTPFRLATVSMVVTVGLMAIFSFWILNIPLGAAVLLGAILAPTDPVLATEIQVRGMHDDDRVRFSLTGEAGLNDGTAFPMVMLGLGLLGLHDLGSNFSRWLLIDVLWASTIGIAIGAVLGKLTARAMHRLAERNLHSDLMENFAGLGLIALAYGLSLVFHAYGFLAVFAAGLMFHRTEARLDHRAKSLDNSANFDEIDAPHLSRVSLSLVSHLERLMEVALLILVGGMLFADSWQWSYVACAATLLFIVRPLSVVAGLIGSKEPALAKITTGWFGVKGIGSFYYLMYSIQHGLDDELAVELISVVLVVVAVSVVLHGITAKPVMRWYAARVTS